MSSSALQLMVVAATTGAVSAWKPGKLLLFLIASASSLLSLLSCSRGAVMCEKYGFVYVSSLLIYKKLYYYCIRSRISTLLTITLHHDQHAHPPDEDYLDVVVEELVEHVVHLDAGRVLDLLREELAWQLKILSVE